MVNTNNSVITKIKDDWGQQVWDEQLTPLPRQDPLSAEMLKRMQGFLGICKDYGMASEYLSAAECKQMLLEDSEETKHLIAYGFIRMRSQSILKAEIALLEA